MKKMLVPVKPQKMKMLGRPSWFNEHGSKVQYVGFEYADLPSKAIILQSSSVYIEIYRDLPGICYTVFYKINQSPDTSHNIGVICMLPEQLKAAFGISNTRVAFNGSQWLADEYGANVAFQGKFIRYGKFLNIPGPGTGWDGDANVSIMVGEELQEAIKILMK